MRDKMSYLFSLTHPGFCRLTSLELCPSLCKERGEATARWLACLAIRQGVSKLKCDKKYFSILTAGCRILFQNRWFGAKAGRTCKPDRGQYPSQNHPDNY